jgi:hypothetical protein
VRFAAAAAKLRAVIITMDTITTMITATIMTITTITITTMITTTTRKPPMRRV